MKKTSIALIAKCKCQNIVAATMIIGGSEIDSDFTETLASVYGRGGKIETIDTDKYTVRLEKCNCEN